MRPTADWSRYCARKDQSPWRKSNRKYPKGTRNREKI